MTLDVRGSLKKTRFNDNNYTFIDELFANAIDSFLIRKDSDKSAKDFKFELAIDMYNTDLDGSSLSFSLFSRDNGVGLGEEQVKAFVTKDTSYKDDLKINGIGKCKGSGRIQYLLYFSKVDIESVHKAGAKLQKTVLAFDDAYNKEISEEDFSNSLVQSGDVGFEINLTNLKNAAIQNIQAYGNMKKDFVATEMKNHILIFFLQRLVSLKTQLGEFSINISSKYQEQVESVNIAPSDLPEITRTHNIEIAPQNAPAKQQAFKIIHYKLTLDKYVLTKNTVALCARSAIVLDVTKKYLRSAKLENNPVNDFYHIVLIESEYLDDYVNEQRNNFDLPKDLTNKGQESFFGDLISKEEIFQAIEPTVINMLSPPDWDRDKIVGNIAVKYGISAKMLKDVDVRIKYGETEDTVVKRVLTHYQEQVIKDTSEIFDIKTEILSLSPDSEDFREKVNKLSWLHTSSLKSMDMANLSQVVVRRAAIVEILSLASLKKLHVQVDNNGRKKNEAIIHNIFFPMQKDSTEVSEHDIWLLNEEYHYYDYIASDMALSKIKLKDSELLFDSDIDDKLLDILKKNNKENSLKRPDIAIFNKEGAAIIIEFKAPDVSLDDHVADLMEYSQLLAAKSNGRIKKFYGYLIGDTVNQNRMRGYKKFPNGDGWFGTDEIREHSTGACLGELYSEILFYDDIVNKANARLEVYKKKLALDF